MIAEMTCPVCGTVSTFGWVAGVNEPAEAQHCVAYGTIEGSPPALCNHSYAAQEIIDAGVEE